MFFLLSQVKSTNQNDVIPNDIFIKKSTAVKSSQPGNYHETQYNEDILMSPNNYTCEDSLWEPMAFGYPAFIEDHFMAAGQHPYISNQMYQMSRDDCSCHLDKFTDIFSRDFSCIDNFMVPEQNAVC